MATTAKLFGRAIEKAFKGEINWATGAIKVMFTSSAYVPDQDAHQYKSSVINEITDAGYTVRGYALANKAITYDAATNVTKFDADDQSLPSPITAARAIVYQDTGNDATSPLICFIDFGVDTTLNILQWDAAGIFTHTAA